MQPGRLDLSKPPLEVTRVRDMGYLGMGVVLDTPGCSEMARGLRQPDPQGNFFIDQ